MTTTVRETTAPQSPVVDEPLTDVERRALLLEAAALEIEVRGWTQGSEGMPYCYVSPKACLLGAICYAAGGREGVSDYSYAEDVFGSNARGTVSIYGWNDSGARTADEVTFVLRWRAAELRDGWDAA